MPDSGMTPAISVESAPDHTLDRFFDLIEASLSQQTFVKLVLAKPRASATHGLRLSVRAITLKGQPSLTFVTSHATRDDTQNFSLAAGLTAVRESVAHNFSHAHLLTAQEEIQLLTSKKGKRSLSRHKASQTEANTSDAHDHQKQRLIHQNRPWLIALGVTDAQHQVVPAMSRKWKQINKFVEEIGRAHV